MSASSSLYDIKGKWDHIITDSLQRRKDTGNRRVLFFSESRSDGRQSGELELPKATDSLGGPREDSAGLADDFSSVQTFAHTTMPQHIFDMHLPNMVYYFCK